ncbi:MAG: ATP synthase F1 subunit delta [Rickettsiales endosymbiont of Dermacentor nuttalli]
MSTYGYSDLIRRYVKSLMDLVQKSNNEIKIEQDFNSLLKLLSTDNNLLKLMNSPIVQRRQLVCLVEIICTQYNYQDLTKKFCILLAKNRRLFLLPGIINRFNHLMLEKRGEVSVQVIVAHSSLEKHVNTLAKEFEKVFTQKVSINFIVDSKILGGMVVKLGSKMLDGSLRNKIARLKTMGMDTIYRVN